MPKVAAFLSYGKAEKCIINSLGLKPDAINLKKSLS